MNTYYRTNRLILQILTPYYTKQVLTFYDENKEFFEQWEAERPSNFYTFPYQKATLSAEYNHIIKSEYLRFYVFEKENQDKIIGTVSFSNFLRGAFETCTIGYKFHHDYCQKGYATEALSFSIPLVFQDLKMHRIEALVHPYNLPSKKLLDKLAFEPEGIVKKAVLLNGVWQDHEKYALV